jgi:hypothetical protein
MYSKGAICLSRLFFNMGLFIVWRHILSYWRHSTSRPTMERSLSYVLLESPFASVSTVRRGSHSLVSFKALLELLPTLPISYVFQVILPV